MKYILWGAGLRGKHALQMLGSANVLAFVDGNAERWGETFCGKKVLSFEQALEQFPEGIYIITPMVADGIEEQLRQKDIYARFFLDEPPMEFAFVDDTKDLFEIYPLSISEKNCGIYGITIFSLLLYEYLKKKYDIEIVLCPQAGFDERFLSLLKNDYTIRTFEETLSNVKQWIAVKNMDSFEAKRGSLNQVIDIFELMKKSINYYSREIAALKGAYLGKRCFIIATGPSLLPSDLDILHAHGELCLSMNKIYRIFDRTEWRPDFYFIEDQYMIEEISEEVANLELPYKFVTAVPSSYWAQEKAESSIKLYCVCERLHTLEPKFSEEMERYAYDGKTVTYICLQMAAYMGFREIYLLGVDFNYTNRIDDAQNHFAGYHTSDNADKKTKFFPFMKEDVQVSYESAKRYADSHNMKIYNATRGGKLEVFERVEFDKLFDGK